MALGKSGGRPATRAATAGRRQAPTASAATTPTTTAPASGAGRNGTNVSALPVTKKKLEHPQPGGPDRPEGVRRDGAHREGT
ncbi:MAG: hypothetical protein QM765_23470 [Myxococcales bacterium]